MAATVWISAQLFCPAADRSILKPVSVEALSVQERSIRVCENGVALRSLGPAGAHTTVETATGSEKVESPALLKAWTR